MSHKLKRLERFNVQDFTKVIVKTYKLAFRGEITLIFME